MKSKTKPRANHSVIPSMPFGCSRSSSKVFFVSSKAPKSSSSSLRKALFFSSREAPLLLLRLRNSLKVEVKDFRLVVFFLESSSSLLLFVVLFRAHLDEMRCRRCGRCTGKAAAVNEFCDDDETPARILYALNSLYIKVSLKLLSLFKIYTSVYIHSLASSFLFLTGLLTSSAQILCEGVSCFSQFRKERERNVLLRFF